LSVSKRSLTNSRTHSGVYSNGFDVDQALVYPGQHCVSAGKRDIYSVEGGNADLRDDSAALARKTRCFARSVPSVRDTRKLVIIGYNQQQLRTFRYPTYHRTLVECVSP
jgi:IS1 family transposase